MTDSLSLLLAAIRCDMAYMEPSFGPVRCAQLHVQIINGIQYVSVAGTNDRADCLNDIQIGWVTRGRLGVVRDGFADAWDPFRDAGPAGLGIDPSLPVRIEGHSLGVPVAQYLAAELIGLGITVLGGIGFGPPTGWDKDGGFFPAIPWVNVKNGYDGVAGRPWLLWPGTAGGEWLQVDAPKIRRGMRHPAVTPLKFWRKAADHKLQGPGGYIAALGACAEAGSLVKDWRALPEAVDWARAVVAFNDRGRKPL